MLAARRLIAHLHTGDPGGSGAAPAPVDERPDLLRVTFEHGLDPPVGPVAYTAGETGVAGPARARHPEADALHPALDHDALTDHAADARGRAESYPAARWIAARMRT